MPGRELIIARLVGQESEVEEAAVRLSTRRPSLGDSVRFGAFTTSEPAADAVRLAKSQDVELVLLAAPALGESAPTDELRSLLECLPADVGILVGSPPAASGEAIYVPFGGTEHDWSALELAAWLALATAAPLRLVGTGADSRRGRRDASRLLADASLAVQRVVRVDATPQLAERSEDALVEAVEPAQLVVIGISPRWREDVGATRRTLIRRGRPPVLLVRDGVRPGGLAPPKSRTRYSWSIEAP